MVRVRTIISSSLQKMFKKEVLKTSRVRFTFIEELDNIVSYARKHHRFKSRTGLLESSIENHVVEYATLRGTIRIDDGKCKYGKWINDGTKRHYIEPINKKALRFVVNSSFVFSKGHFVSGIKAEHFIENAVEKTKGRLNQKMLNAIVKEYLS